MHNVVSVSGGNDSIAMLITIANILNTEGVRKELFSDDYWYIVYLDTGWSRKGWDKRINIVKNLCNRYGFEFHTIKAPINKNLIADTGMLAHVAEKGMFPNVKMKWCTTELKIKPMQRWLKEQGFTPYNTRQWIGIRRAEGSNRGGTKSIDRANVTSLGERDGFDVVYPLAYMTTRERDLLLDANNVPIYPGRSDECYPCIFSFSIKQLAELDVERVGTIMKYEKRITQLKHARSAMYGIQDRAFYSMFNPKRCGGNEGIIRQVNWAKCELNKMNKTQQGDLFIINDKCESGYCGV